MLLLPTVNRSDAVEAPLRMSKENRREADVHLRPLGRGAGRTDLPVISPEDGESFDSIARGGAHEVDLAVQAARSALGGAWGRMSGQSAAAC